jgi:hypothetical protein
MRAAWLFLGSWALAVQAPQPDARLQPEVPDQSSFVLGVLRRDGIVSPFATFDGESWTEPWPTELRFLDLPISIDAVPRKWWGKAAAPAEMAVWAGGVRRGTLRLEGPTTLRIMCSSRLALRSDYRSSESVPPPIEQPFPKDGLAVSGPVTVAPIDVVPRTSPEWASAALQLPDPVEAAELNAARAFSAWKHPVPRAERRKVPVELETLYKAPMDAPGWTAYYFEAVKRYRPGPKDGDCGLLTSASGWIAVGPGGKHWTEIGARVTYCDRKDDIYMLPLGLLKAGGRTYWSYQLSGYGREGYVVAHPTAKVVEMEIQYPAGSCPR